MPKPKKKTEEPFRNQTITRSSIQAVLDAKPTATPSEVVRELMSAPTDRHVARTAKLMAKRKGVA